MLVVICPLAFTFLLGRNGPRVPIHAQRCVGFLRSFFHITMQMNCMRCGGWFCYTETCLCLISYTSESYSCVECLMILQVQFPLGNNRDFVPVTAWQVKKHLKESIFKVNNSWIRPLHYVRSEKTWVLCLRCVWGNILKATAWKARRRILKIDNYFILFLNKTQKRLS